MLKPSRWIALVGLLVFAGGSRASAQGKDGFNGLHLTGSINDFTTPMNGAWAIHGTWSLDVTGGPDAASFSAALTMGRSDLFFSLNPADDPNNLGMRNAHTHHILVVNGTVTSIPGGFRVTGHPSETTITLNGAVPTFETPMPTSTLQIDVTGGSIVAFSNVALTFGGPAQKHFGSNPIAGVVSGVK